MTRREAMRQTSQIDNLRGLGFTTEEAESLRRISMTLHRWNEMECGVDGGCIERDDVTGKPYWLNSYTSRRTPIADREAGALRRLMNLLDARNGRHVEHEPLYSYVQGDPRGAALYLIRPGDVPPQGDVQSYYTRGLCIY